MPVASGRADPRTEGKLAPAPLQGAYTSAESTVPRCPAPARAEGDGGPRGSSRDLGADPPGDAPPVVRALGDVVVLAVQVALDQLQGGLGRRDSRPELLGGGPGAPAGGRVPEGGSGGTALRRGKRARLPRGRGLPRTPGTGTRGGGGATDPLSGRPDRPGRSGPGRHHDRLGRSAAHPRDPARPRRPPGRAPRRPPVPGRAPDRRLRRCHGRGPHPRVHRPRDAVAARGARRAGLRGRRRRPRPRGPVARRATPTRAASSSPSRSSWPPLPPERRASPASRAVRPVGHDDWAPRVPCEARPAGPRGSRSGFSPPKPPGRPASPALPPRSARTARPWPPEGPGLPRAGAPSPSVRRCGRTRPGAGSRSR